MEGLSIEEKAKRYDKALEKARQLCAYPTSKPFISDLQDLFPELAESEGERIRKAIGYAIGQSTHSDGILINGVSSEEALSWLEKQGNLAKYYEDKLDRCACENFNKGYKKAIEKQGKNNMGISEATKQELEDNLNKALEKETPESCNEFLDEQSCKEENLKERNICDTCEDSNGCLIPCCAKLLEKQGEQKPAAWSEEDKDILFRTINDLKFLRDTISIDPKYAVNIIDTEREINWLKDRYTWRPSNEQMLAINTAINVLGKGTINGKYLIELQEQLKKLKG